MTVNTATEATVVDEEACALARRQLDDGEAIVRAVVDRGQREGSIPADRDAAALTSVIANAWLGLRVRVRAGTGTDELMAGAAAVLALLD
jgi:TetR/AcrR family transcriptional repressor of nem operon